MKHTAVLLLLCAFIMGCSSGGNPFNSPPPGDGGDGDAPPTTPTVPAAIAGSVSSVTFDPANQTLVVTGANLDNTPVSTVYTRNAALDRNGFQAYTNQDGALERHFTAFVAQAGSVNAAVVSSPSPRNRTFRGAFFDRDGAYDPPVVTADTGVVTYAGSYVGLTNIGDPNGNDLISTNITPAVLQPGQALGTDGDVLLSADFADNAVEGNIFNRRLLDTNGNALSNLASLVLIVTPISADGTFEGTIEYDIGDANSNTNAFVTVGSYAGIFGGVDATQVAGGIDLTEFDGSQDFVLGAQNEEESGVFILEACTAANTNPVCTQNIP
ncbi:MAG: thymidylate synthase [Pseudomonadota bacterium]